MLTLNCLYVTKKKIFLNLFHDIKWGYPSVILYEILDKNFVFVYVSAYNSDHA